MTDGVEPSPFQFKPFGELYDDFRVVGEHRGVGGKLVRVLAEEGVGVGEDAAARIVAGVEEASRLFVAITGQSIEMAYPSGVSDPMVAKIHGRNTGVMWDTDLNGHRMVLTQSVETVAAGVLHEFVESYREELDLVGDGVPFLAEFLFCGPDRKIFEEMAERLQRDDPRNQDDSHVKDWADLARLVLGEEYREGDWTENQRKMGEMKAGLDETGRVNLVRSYLTI